MAGVISNLARIYRDVHNKLCTLAVYSERRVAFGQNVYVASGALFRAKHTSIGDYTRINGPIRIVGDQEVIIGKYCAIGAYVTMVSSNHATHHANLQVALHQQFGFDSLSEDRGPTVVGHNVWIGDNATLLPGVRVGDGAVLAAAAVVTENVPPFSIVAGIPARVIRKRFHDEMIQALEEVRWWDWTPRKIAQNRRFFEADLREISHRELRALIKDAAG